MLQPVLYAVALEAITGEPVDEGRLSYCTAAGGFTTHAIALDPIIRGRGLEVLEIVDRAIEHGTLAARPGGWATAAPASSATSARCAAATRPRRVKRKPPLADLDALRRFS